ncbi:MAG: hypothetical protein MJA84_00990, partial [Firmicutes bacterium]|nr:hypothetical protein [Bacillota bacterium]
ANQFIRTKKVMEDFLNTSPITHSLLLLTVWSGIVPDYFFASISPSIFMAGIDGQSIKHKNLPYI